MLSPERGGSECDAEHTAEKAEMTLLRNYPGTLDAASIWIAEACTYQQTSKSRVCIADHVRIHVTYSGEV